MMRDREEPSRRHNELQRQASRLLSRTVWLPFAIFAVVAVAQASAQSPSGDGAATSAAELAIESYRDYAQLVATVYLVAAGFVTLAGALAAFLGITSFREMSEKVVSANAALDRARGELNALRQEIEATRLDSEVAVDLDIVRIHQDSHNDWLPAKRLLDEILKDAQVDARLRAIAFARRARSHARIAGHDEHALSDVVSAIELLRSLDKKHPVSSHNMLARAYFNAACYASKLGRHDECGAFLLEAINRRPEWKLDISSDKDLEKFCADRPDQLAQLTK